MFLQAGYFDTGAMIKTIIAFLIFETFHPLPGDAERDIARRGREIDTEGALYERARIEKKHSGGSGAGRHPAGGETLSGKETEAEGKTHEQAGAAETEKAAGAVKRHQTLKPDHYTQNLVFT